MFVNIKKSGVDFYFFTISWKLNVYWKSEVGGNEGRVVVCFVFVNGRYIVLGRFL